MLLPQCAYIAPTFEQAKRIAWSYCREFASAIPDAKFHETELRIDLPGKERIWLLGAENPDRLRGLYLDYVVLDEYADIQERLFPEIIRPVLAERNGGALWLGTPRGYNRFGKFTRPLAKQAWRMILSGMPVFTKHPIPVLFPKRN